MISLKGTYLDFIHKGVTKFPSDTKFSQLGETNLIFWSTGKTEKKLGSVGRQNKNII